MKVDIAYGRDGLTIDVPDENLYSVVEPTFVPGLEDPNESITESIRNPIGSLPLSKIVKAGTKVTIVVSDKTRPVPSHEILPPLIERLKEAL